MEQPRTELSESRDQAVVEMDPTAMGCPVLRAYNSKRTESGARLPKIACKLEYCMSEMWDGEAG